jgi:hypothetical protein
MIVRFIKRAFRKNREFPYGKCFVSFAYEDQPVIDQLHERLDRHAQLSVFPPINVTPEEMVSNELLRTIRRCDSLIYIVGGQSSTSPWVTLERDYALRFGLDVYFFDQQNATIERDTSAPLDLLVFASYSHADDERVQDLLDFMRRKRSFDIFKDKKILGLTPTNGAEALNAIDSRLERGGYLALFWSYKSSESRWVNQEMRRAFLRSPDRIMPVLLDPIELPPELDNVIPVKLYRKDGLGIDKRRLDDLIVRLYWLIHKNLGEKKASAK